MGRGRAKRVGPVEVRSRRGRTGRGALGLGLVLLAVPLACRQARLTPVREPIVGLPCEGCEAVFDGLPERLEAQARIAPPEEPGEPLRIEGVVTDLGGKPVPDVVVYAYHTNAGGVYPPGPDTWGPSARRHGLLRGWARTDDAGRYRFDTIRPGSYPGRETPSHVHMHVLEPGRCTYTIDSIHFLDDPKLTQEQREADSQGRGGSGLVTPVRGPGGEWVVRRDIHLGEGVPEYPAQSNSRPDGD